MPDPISTAINGMAAGGVNSAGMNSLYSAVGQSAVGPATYSAVGSGGFGAALGNAAFGNPATGSSGFFGSGGKFGLGETLGTVGMGAAIAQSFGSSQGSSPIYSIPLPPEGEALQKRLTDLTVRQFDEDLMPRNVADIYIGQIKKKVGAEEREARGLVQKLGSRTDQPRSGKDAQAGLTAAGVIQSGRTAPGDFMRERRIQSQKDAITNAQNLFSITKNTPHLRMSAGLAQSAADKYRAAGRGQALGDAATYAAMVRYPMA